MKKDWKLFALHILDCIEKIQQIQEKGNIVEDFILYDAALRNLQTMSEATRHLPKEYTDNFKEIPWQDISGFRNLLVHDYLGTIDPETVADVIKNHIPGLKSAVLSIMEQQK